MTNWPLIPNSVVLNHFSDLNRRHYILISCLLAFILMSRCSQTEKQFTEIPKDQSGIDFRNDIQETQHTNIMTYEYTYNGGGVAAGDLNNDKLPDIYFSGNEVANKLYINKGEWRFEDVTAASGTAGREDWKTGVTMADVNGDGWLDIYICYSGNAPGEGYNRPVVKDYPKRANQLFINNGCEPGGVPTFTERAKKYGLDAIGTFSTQAYFFDYDLDGDLDMFLVNHANMFYAAFFNTNRLRNLRHPYFGNKLYRNDSKQEGGAWKISFTDVSEQSGFHGSGLNFGLSASISDINLDGWPDIYVTNDYEEQDFCYINKRNGTFEEVSHTMFGHLSKFGMGSDIADMNNDGLQEILVLDMLPEDNYRQKLLKGPDEYDRYTLAVDSGYHHQYMRNTLQLNRGLAPDSLPRFSEVGQLAGISNTDWSWSPFFVDLDNDGLKDIFVTNGYLRDFTNLDFMKYTSTVYQEAKVANKDVDYLSLIQQLPVTRVTNYVYRNQDGLQFENVSEKWGLTQTAVSNGAAYADFDGDGDLDLVTNNLNDGVTLLRNNQETLQGNNFIKLQLRGNTPNTFGIGAKIFVETDSTEIFQEAFFTRGYASSVDHIITIGLGKSKNVKKLTVQWADGTKSTQENIPVNQYIEIEQMTSAQEPSGRGAPNQLLLTDVTKTSGLNFQHKENNFIDFKMQRLLYYQLSRLGGKLASGDVNGDGNDDVFVTGASGQAGALYLGRDDGTFVSASPQPWSSEVAFEDIDALFFDADQDGDQDLYVVSGGSEFVAGAPLYQDRLYINDGKGNFKKTDDALPVETVSGSCVTAGDFDNDGDLDLFVGGRQVPGQYGVVPISFILENKSANGKVSFVNATNRLSASLTNVGMVTAAAWADIDGDNWIDLIVTGEWMPVRVFKNDNGELREQSFNSLANTEGWWCSIFPADVDGDGDTDFLLGNAGTNLQFKPSIEEPVELNVTDLNNDGTLDPILTYYIQGQSYPLASRDELLDQVANFRKKYIKYEDYAKVTIRDFASEEQLEKAYKFKANTLQSAWIENLEGKDLVMRELPYETQFSTINGFVQLDVDGNGEQEIIAAGNFFPFKPQLGKCDASMGTILNFRDGQLKTLGGMKASVWMDGDIRDIALLKFRNGHQVVVSRNNGETSVYRYSGDNVQ